MRTKEKLTRALMEANAPAAMVERARAGYYDDYESPCATPIANLVRELQANGLGDLAKRAVNGEFDASREEAEEWFQREGKDLLS